jgi:hypothetical protein
VSSIEQGPSPRNALSSVRLRTSSAWRLGRRHPDVRRLFTPADPFGPSEARLPSTRPVASGRRASMSLGVACRLLQPFIDARAHPTSVRSSHASGAFAPLLAGTNRCRLRWFHGALPHWEPASHGLFAPAFARRVPLAWTGQTVGRGARAKADARSWTIRACPPRSAPSTRVAGSTCREVWSPPRLVAPA